MNAVNNYCAQINMEGTATVYEESHDVAHDISTRDVIGRTLIGSVNISVSVIEIVRLLNSRS